MAEGRRQEAESRKQKAGELLDYTPIFPTSRKEIRLCRDSGI
jgi:hypothetical protein